MGAEAAGEVSSGICREATAGRPPELEVWFSADTTFRVLGAGTVDGTSVTVLHQMDTVTGRLWRPLADVDQVLATYGRDASTGRAAGRAYAATPGKFVGELR